MLTLMPFVLVYPMSATHGCQVMKSLTGTSFVKHL